MNKKFALVLLLCAALLLSGCRFAMEETHSANEDVLVGMALRVYDPGEPDGYDDDGNAYWYNTEPENETELTPEQVKALMGGGPVDLTTGQNEYPIGEHYCYITQTEDENGVTNIAELSWPGKVNQHFTTTDTGEEFELDATVYLNSESFGSFVSFHLDPIYRRADGTLYSRHDLAGVSGHIQGFSQSSFLLNAH